MFRSGENQKPPAEIGITILYCKSPRPTHQTVLGFIASVTRQLVEQGKDHSPLLIRAKEFKQKHSGEEKPATLEEYSKFLSEILDSFSKVYLMVDALDEFAAPSQDRENLVKTLLELKHVAEGKLRLFITSRPASEIREKLGIKSKVDICASDPDIESYIDHRIAQYTQVMEWVQRYPHLKNKMVTTVKEKARHM